MESSLVSGVGARLVRHDRSFHPLYSAPVEIDQSHLLRGRSRSPTRLSAATKATSTCQCSPRSRLACGSAVRRASRAGGVRLHREPRRGVGAVRPQRDRVHERHRRGRRGNHRGRKAVGRPGNEGAQPPTRSRADHPRPLPGRTQPLGDGRGARAHAARIAASDAIPAPSGEAPPPRHLQPALRGAGCSTTNLLSGGASVTGQTTTADSPQSRRSDR